MALISAQQKQYLSERMDEVSRSFALVVRSLKSPLDDHLATAYLLCRVADNIEDCAQPVSWQRERFVELKALLSDPASAAEVLTAWEKLDWPGLTPSEARMMGMTGGLPLWEIYSRTRGTHRESIRRWVSTMVTGMESLNDPQLPPRIVADDGVRFLADVPDYNEYCYYVAGTVGHMATEIVAQHYDFSSGLSADLSMLSEACGRGLQKTNIVKDFKHDLGRGISYLPGTWLEEAGYAPLRLEGAPASWAQMVIGDVLTDLRTATEYLINLPVGAADYRMASLLSLLPAYQTIFSAAKHSNLLFTVRHQAKISRITMFQCRSDARAMLSNNEAIRAYCSRMEDEIEATFCVS